MNEPFTKESCQIFEWIMHEWVISTWCNAYEWISITHMNVSHIWMDHTHMNEPFTNKSCNMLLHIWINIASHTWMYHTHECITHMNEPFTNKSCNMVLHIWINIVSHTWMYHTYEWTICERIISNIRMGHGWKSHINDINMVQRLRTNLFYEWVLSRIRMTHFTRMNQ